MCITQLMIEAKHKLNPGASCWIQSAWTSGGPQGIIWWDSEDIPGYCHYYHTYYYHTCTSLQDVGGAFGLIFVEREEVKMRFPSSSMTMFAVLKAFKLYTSI